MAVFEMLWMPCRFPPRQPPRNERNTRLVWHPLMVSQFSSSLLDAMAANFMRRRGTGVCSDVPSNTRALLSPSNNLASEIHRATGARTRKLPPPGEHSRAHAFQLVHCTPPTGATMPRKRLRTTTHQSPTPPVWPPTHRLKAVPEGLHAVQPLDPGCV